MASTFKAILHRSVGLACAALLAWAAPAAATTFTFGEFVTFDQNVWGADPL
jgi:hypothetical protein